MGEHVGAGNYPAFLTSLHRQLRPCGRLLVQQMSHGPGAPGGGPFIERYIAPDMHIRPLAETVALVEAAGFEVRDVQALREHYVRTVEAWHDEFERRWDEVVSLVGIEQARVWRLYLVGGALAFEQNRMGVDQILAVRVTADGVSGVEPTRLGWEPQALRDGSLV
jgi:cyclopropane-fatty-acyl-phospholipid synthase